MQTRTPAIASALFAAFMATVAGAASMDLSREIDAQGAKPAWSLKVSHGIQFKLTRAGKPPLLATAPGAAIAAGGASWSAKTSDGQLMKVSVQAGSCTLGARQFPMTARVELAAETLSGCAGYAP